MWDLYVVRTLNTHIIYSNYDRCGIQTRDGAEPDSAMAVDAAGGRVSQIALSLAVAANWGRFAFVISRALYLPHVRVIGISASLIGRILLSLLLLLLSSSSSPFTIIRQESNGTQLLIQPPCCSLLARRCRWVVVVVGDIVVHEHEMSISWSQSLRTSRNSRDWYCRKNHAMTSRRAVVALSMVAILPITNNDVLRFYSLMRYGRNCANERCKFCANARARDD